MHPSRSLRLLALASLVICGAGCSSDKTVAGENSTPSAGRAGVAGSASNAGSSDTGLGGSSPAAGAAAIAGAADNGGASGSAGSAGASAAGAGGSAGTTGALAGSGGMGSAGAPSAGAAAGSDGATTISDGGTGAPSFHCVNWAVNGDNFQPRTLLLSGIFASDTSYEAVKSRAIAVENAYTDLLKANSFRMPINESTVNNASIWAAYRAVIDVGVEKGMKVVIAFWAKDMNIGKPVDVNAWYTMWKTVIDAYVASPTVYFDIHNEPHGYDTDHWVQQVKDWIAKFPSVPRNRIIVAGSGWDTNVSKVDQAFPDLMLEVHDYSFNTPSNGGSWAKQLLDRSSAGNYKRTIVGEWGTGVQGGNFAAAGSNDFMVAFANTIKDNQMGSCWWPGLWAIPGETSSWSLLSLNGTQDKVTYSIQNQSALDRIWHSWGIN